MLRISHGKDEQPSDWPTHRVFSARVRDAVRVRLLSSLSRRGRLRLNMRVLMLKRDPFDERTGVFTSGIVSVGEDRKIAL